MRVLDVDPELGYRLDDEERAAVRRYAVAEVIALRTGRTTGVAPLRDTTGPIHR